MDTSDSFRVVRWFDPEVARHCDINDIVRYRETRDLEDLSLPPNAKPIVFTCRLLTRAQRRHVKSMQDGYLRHEAAFAYGVTSIAGLPRGNGKVEDVTPHRHGRHEPIPDDELDRLELGDDDIEDIGLVILTKSTLGKGVPLRCPVLDSSRHAWLAVATSHRAEQSTDNETPADESSG